MPEICTTGKWVDKKTGQVVDREPAEGRLLVAPGTEFTPNAKALVERHVAAAPPAPPVPAVEENAEPADERDDDGDTETASEAGASETAAKSGRTGTARKRT